MPLTTVSPGLLDSTAQYYSFKNRIINGEMVIDQRNAGASVTNVVGGIYTIDRWSAAGFQASKFTVQQNAGSVTPPAGFVNYLGCTSSSAYTVGASEYFDVDQCIEGLNVADLGWGTANAQTVTFSFWVRSSLTGTFGGAINNSGDSRSYPFTYTISSANTWEQKTVTVAGDTSGTWLKTNGIGLRLRFSLGAGSTYSGTAGSWSGSTYISATGATSVVGTNGATFYITGVQLEKGSTATSFDYRPYGTEFMLCQRYFQKYTNPPLRGVFSTTTVVSRAGIFIPTMRVAPTITIGGSYNFFDGTSVVSDVTTAGAVYSNVNGIEIDFNAGATGSCVAGRPAVGYIFGAITGFINASAEL